MPPVLTTDRLVVRPFALDDAPFVCGLLNEPSFLRWIGDRGVRSVEDARAYLDAGPLASYAAHGHGLALVARRADGAPLGTCGLLRRPALDAPDLGFAFVPAAWGHGYAREAARAVLDDGRDRLGLRRVVAVADPDNAASRAVLHALGFRPDGTARLAPDGAALDRFVAALQA